MRTVEIIRDEVLRSNNTYESNDVLNIIDEIVGLKNEQIENIARNLEAQGKQHDKEKEQIIKAFEDEKERAYSDFETYANELSIDEEYDDFFHSGLSRAIDIVKRGGVEWQL